MDPFYILELNGLINILPCSERPILGCMKTMMISKWLLTRKKPSLWFKEIGIKKNAHKKYPLNIRTNTKRHKLCLFVKVFFLLNINCPRHLLDMFFFWQLQIEYAIFITRLYFTGIDRIA